MAVGDINSSARGSAARYNDDKVQLGLLDAGFLAELCEMDLLPQPEACESTQAQCWRKLADWQRGGTSKDPLTALSWIADFEGLSYPEVAKGIADVLDYGRKKYAAWNWAKGQPWMVVYASMSRHLIAFFEEEEVDRESGLPHWAHFGCNVMFLYTFERVFPEGDDRPGELRLPQQAEMPFVMIDDYTAENWRFPYEEVLRGDRDGAGEAAVPGRIYLRGPGDR